MSGISCKSSRHPWKLRSCMIAKTPRTMEDKEGYATLEQDDVTNQRESQRGSGRSVGFQTFGRGGSNESLGRETQSTDLMASKSSGVSKRFRPGQIRFNDLKRVATHGELIGLNYDQLHQNIEAESKNTRYKRALNMIAKKTEEMEPEPVMVSSIMEAEAKQIEDLVKMGWTVEQISESVYKHMQDDNLPNFLDRVHLDKDGGLDRIDEIWMTEKIFWFLYLVIGVAYNLIYLLSINWVVFEGFLQQVTKQNQQLMSAVGSQIRDHALTWDSLINETESLEVEASANAVRANIYMQIEDPERRYKILSMAGLVGFAEVVWVFISICEALSKLVIFCCSRSEYRSFKAITDFWQDSMPILSTFSLLRLISAVHPALIYTKYLELQNHSCLSHSSSTGPALTAIWFLVSRTAAAVLAVQAFAVKLTSTGLKLMNPRYQFSACMFSTIGLLNQVVGCVQFERVLQDRLFLFIFGGADTAYKEDELALRNCYRTRIAKTIWEEYWVQKRDPVKTICLLSTLDHYDLQRLILDEDRVVSHFSTSMASSKGMQAYSTESRGVSEIEIP